jgi:hypothetical protein
VVDARAASSEEAADVLNGGHVRDTTVRLRPASGSRHEVIASATVSDHASQDIRDTNYRPML